MTEHTKKATRSEFARILQCAPSWITKLDHDGRLAIDPADGLILVNESLELIEQTRGGRHDVAERNADRRTEASDPDGTRRRERAAAELRIKRAEADRAELARDREAGQLLAREDVGFAMRDIGAFVRTALEVFPDQVAPLIAERLGLAGDRVPDVHDVLTRECHAALERIAAKLREPQPYDKRA